MDSGGIVKEHKTDSNNNNKKDAKRHGHKTSRGNVLRIYNNMSFVNFRLLHQKLPYRCFPKTSRSSSPLSILLIMPLRLELPGIPLRYLGINLRISLTAIYSPFAFSIDR